MNRSKDDAFSKAIESAVERGNHHPTGQGLAGIPGDQHAKVDHALRQRLQQLRTAMGDEPQRAEPPAPFALHPMPALGNPVHERAQPLKAHGSRLVFWLFSTVVLGGAAWYVLGGGPARNTAATPSARMAQATPPDGVSTPPAPTAPPASAAPATPPPAPVDPFVAAAPSSLIEPGSPASAASGPAPAEQPAEAAAQVATAAADVTAPTAPSAVPGATPLPDPSEQLRALVESWRQAWSNRDTERYLSFYSAAFEPGKGLSLAQWRAGRYRNVGGKSDIEVGINELQLASISERAFRITFLQDYTSGNYQESAQPKTLIVAREGEAWRIIKEWQGNRAY